MPNVNFSEQALQAMMKQAVIDALEERRDLLRDVVAEVFEDLALTEAIKEGLTSEAMERAEVFSLLRGQE